MIVCDLLGGSEAARFFLSFVYICITVGGYVIKVVRIGIPLTGLTPPYL